MSRTGVPAVLDYVCQSISADLVSEIIESRIREEHRKGILDVLSNLARSTLSVDRDEITRQVESEAFPCDHCGSVVKAIRYAQHLEKCMGVGRGARTSRRKRVTIDTEVAKSSKRQRSTASLQQPLPNDDDDEDGDDDKEGNSENGNGNDDGKANGSEGVARMRPVDARVTFSRVFSATQGFDALESLLSSEEEDTDTPATSGGLGSPNASFFASLEKEPLPVQPLPVQSVVSAPVEIETVAVPLVQKKEMRSRIIRKVPAKP